MFNDDVPPLQRVYQGSRIGFLVLGRDLVASITPDVPYLIISITDPDRPEALLAASPLCRAVLRLRFHDTSQIDVPGLEEMTLGNEAPMTAEDARAIVAFVAQHLEQVELIVCQCEAGVSRSAGVAAALSRIMQSEDSYFFHALLAQPPRLPVAFAEREPVVGEEYKQHDRAGLRGRRAPK